MHKSKILECPSHLKKHRNNKEKICIDCGIIKTIKFLWKNEIYTLGCCVGKGFGDRPSVIVSEEYSDNDIEHIRALINKVDNRNWMITQWRNIEIKKTNKPKRPFWNGKNNF